jgi:hypothetical protein
MSTKRPRSVDDLYDEKSYGSFGSVEIATLETGREAVAALNKTIYRWFEIGEAIEIIRQKAERMNDRFAFKRIMSQQGFSMEPGENKVIDKAMVSKLKQVCDRKGEIIAWHETLTPKQKREWAAPNTVIQYFKTHDANGHLVNFNNRRIDEHGHLLDERGERIIKPMTPAQKDRQALAAAEEDNADLRKQLKGRQDGDTFDPKTTPAADMARAIFGQLEPYRGKFKAFVAECQKLIGEGPKKKSPKS